MLMRMQALRTAGARRWCIARGMVPGCTFTLAQHRAGQCPVLVLDALPGEHRPGQPWSRRAAGDFQQWKVEVDFSARGQRPLRALLKAKPWPQAALVVGPGRTGRPVLGASVEISWTVGGRSRTAAAGTGELTLGGNQLGSIQIASARR